MTAQPEPAVAEPAQPKPREAEPGPPPAPEQKTDPPEAELRCTICGLSACWTK